MFVEIDLRAHRNPRRMQRIAEVDACPGCGHRATRLLDPRLVALRQPEGDSSLAIARSPHQRTPVITAIRVENDSKVNDDVIRPLDQPLYAEGKSRQDTYREMVGLMLAEVRAGKRVCGAFYGHPGVFADVPGLCRAVTLGEIAANDYSLTPGRYVGVAAAAAEDSCCSGGACGGFGAWC